MTDMQEAETLMAQSSAVLLREHVIRWLRVITPSYGIRASLSAEHQEAYRLVDESFANIERAIVLLERER